MGILFNISYNTNPGECLAVNIPHNDGTMERLYMKSCDGSNHVAYFDATPQEACCMKYFYSVEQDRKEVRHEWRVVPHMAEWDGKAARLMTLFDRWIDLPDDAFKYSSAFTECVCKRNSIPAQQKDYAKTLCLTVRCPQLRSGMRLALTGDAQVLGGWDVNKTMPMTERQPNEWVVCLDAEKLPKTDISFKFVALDDSRCLWETGGNRRLEVPSMNLGDKVCLQLDQAFIELSDWKGAGTVIPVFSLRSEGSFGVGDFGDLTRMTDWVAKTGQHVLQLLPINDTGITHTWIDSYPYNSISIYALHPQYTDLRQLPPLKDNTRRLHYESLRQELNALPQIDYERVNSAKIEYLRELFKQEEASILNSKDFKAFFEANKDWLVPYAAFCHCRDLYGTADFSRWPNLRVFGEEEREDMSEADKPTYEEASFWYFVQFNLDRQMQAAHKYARQCNVVLKGDIPIGISRNGVEAWVEPGYFNLDEQAGAPPDAFSANGQNWGFPTYNWDALTADDCSWWVQRFRKMAEYFDAFRIDHVLGFFRIWEIPSDAVHGLLGHFSPALGLTVAEIESYGLPFREELFTRPYITGWVLRRLFGDKTDEICAKYLERLDEEHYKLKRQFSTQRKIEAYFKKIEQTPDNERLRDGLYALVSDVLFLRDRKTPGLFHPRISVQSDFIYESLPDFEKQAFNRLYDDYFYRRNEDYWYREAMKKLPRLAEATRMLACAEDLGMVPRCVPRAMDELKILSLEIQSMPKDGRVRFGCLERNPYRSVCTISTHDMPTLRQWWDEDEEQTRTYYNTVLQHSGEAPHPLPGQLAREIVRQHLASPSMLCLLSLQDWLATDESLRLPEKDAERINVPANPRHYWRYRMHLTIERLLAEDAFNKDIRKMIEENGR